jgi:hypothetical protein
VRTSVAAFPSPILALRFVISCSASALLSIILLGSPIALLSDAVWCRTALVLVGRRFVKEGQAGRQAGRQKRSALCFWFGFVVVVVALGVRLLSVCCFPSFRRLRHFSFVGLFQGFVSVAGSSICCLLILCVKSGKRKCLMGSETVLRMGLQLKTKSELALLRSLRD